MTALLQRPFGRGRFVTTKKVGYDTSSRGRPPESSGRMNSEPAKTIETVGFRVPALVSLAPKRRFKVAVASEEEHDSEEGKNQGHGMHGRPRLKRSGRVIFRRPTPVSQIQANHTYYA